MAKRWKIEYLVVAEGAERRVPGFEFLTAIPKSPRTHLLAILDAVALVGPDKWTDEESHKPMIDPCHHLHEARDRQEQTLYRLYLYWQRDERQVVVLCGKSKANNTILPDSFYDDVARLSRLAEGDDPSFATHDDIMRLALELSDRAAAAEERAEAAERDIDDLLGRE